MKGTIILSAEGQCCSPGRVSGLLDLHPPAASEADGCPSPDRGSRDLSAQLTGAPPKDSKRLEEDLSAGISEAPLENNMAVWNVNILGSEGTPFEDGTIKLRIGLTEEYPNKPPGLRSVSKMPPQIPVEMGVRVCT